MNGCCVNFVDSGLEMANSEFYRLAFAGFLWPVRFLELRRCLEASSSYSGIWMVKQAPLPFSPSTCTQLWLIAGGLAFCNIICALSYCANDFLYDHGLVHGVSRQGALKLYVACAIVLTAAQIAVTALLLSMG